MSRSSGAAKTPVPNDSEQILKNYLNLQLIITFVVILLFSHFPLVIKMIFVSSKQRICVGKFCTHKSSQFVSKVEERQKNNNDVLSRPCH